MYVVSINSSRRTEMIADIVNGNIDKSSCEHIASMFDMNGRFTLSKLGDSMSSDWTGPVPLGTIFSNKWADGITHHSLVCYPDCHSENYEATINSVTEFLTKCLDALDIPDGESVALTIPTCYSNKPIPNHPYDLLGAIARAKKSVTVYFS